MKYIVFDTMKKPYTSGDMFNEEFNTKETAIREADSQWAHLTEQEKKVRTVYVLESVNPDEDTEDHFDGRSIWEDGSAI